MTLDRYPYGCAEQTTSRAMPLLYVAELSKAAGLPEDPDLHGRIQDAIYRVLNYQSTTGSFGLWLTFCEKTKNFCISCITASSEGNAHAFRLICRDRASQSRPCA